ncbi:hypothetical protein Tco_0292176 [Tanacetum coccineum]
MNKDAIVEMPKFNKLLSSLLRNKEKLEEIAIIIVKAECFAIIMNKVPEKLEDSGKFLIPCALQELDRTKKDKDVEITFSPSFILTSPEESDSIPPGINLNLSPTLEVSSSNPTSPTLTGEKELGGAVRWGREVGGTDISNITRKLSKMGKTRTRESEEYKRSQRFKAKAKESQNPVNLGQQKSTTKGQNPK